MIHEHKGQDDPMGDGVDKKITLPKIGISQSTQMGQNDPMGGSLSKGQNMIDLSQT